MKKIITLAFILIATTQFAFSQQAIAKIKYEEAEEAYTANKFELTVTKLNEVEAILKSTNPRVMYLKTMALYGTFTKSYYKNFEVLINVQHLSNKYLKDYENLPDNDDKYRDVYKVAEAVKCFPDDEVKFITYRTNLITKLKKEADDYMYVKDSIDYTKAFNCYTQLLKYGDIRANAELGRCYYNGWSVVQDFKKAFTYATIAADKGDPVAQNLLGLILLINDNGVVPRDATKAQKLFEMAADQGNVKATYNLAYYIYGDASSKGLYYLKLCYEITIQNLEKHIPIGKSPGDLAREISENYRGGYGTKKDKNEAKKWEAISNEMYIKYKLQ